MSTFKTHPLRAFLYATVSATLLGGFLYLVGLGTIAIVLPPMLLPTIFNWYVLAFGSPSNIGGASFHNQTDTDWEDHFLAVGDFKSAVHGTQISGFDD